jgi:adenylate cyclase
MRLVTAVTTQIRRVGSDSADTDELRLQKVMLTSASLLVILAAALWGATYLIFSEPVAGAISLGYSAIMLAGLAIYARTRHYDLFLFSQLVLGLIIPFIHTIVLGGLWHSSVVILWSMASPVGALLFYSIRRARWWWLAYLVVVAAATMMHPLVEHDNHLPAVLQRAFFALNIISVSSISLVTLGYFIAQKNEAYRLLGIEQRKAENLLLNVLPRDIAAILKNEERVIADSFDGASILFADLVNFTPLTAHMPPRDVVNLLNDIFSHFDSLVEKYDVEKIRTMGDNYMVAAGAPRARPDHALCLAAMALDMQAYVAERNQHSGLPLEFRIGINSGPVIGGVIGRKRFVYDVWGDAVNIASRMESQGVPSRIQVSQTTCDLICEQFTLEHRGTVSIKGKGEMDTWFLTGHIRSQADGEDTR